MREDEFYSNMVAPQLKRWGDHCRIENSAGTGTPDINYAVEGHHGWIETKVIHRNKLMFEKFQLPWLKRRGRHMAQKNLWVLAIDEAKLVYLYTAHSMYMAPRAIYKKWTVVLTTDVVPVAVGLKPWETIYQALTDRLVSSDEFT